MEDGRKRRSARLSALDKCKQERASGGGVQKVEKRAGNGKETGRGQGVPEKKRGRKRKRLMEVEEVVVNSVEKVVGETGHNLKQNGYLCSAGKSLSSASCMPEQQVLELILDILQKKDTHETFAEPVDPDEVEGYYDIIKNPMDFGTMRAKLQEGIYTTLEQFENDVYLICSNAMHFNSPSTVFFRQARSIQELAKKAFQTLRTDAGNFESAFSNTRGCFLKKAMKSHVNGRIQADVGSSDYHSHAKSATGVRSSNLTTNIASNYRQRLLQGNLGLKRNFEGPMICSPTSLVENRRKYEDLSGFRDGRKSNFVEDERRFNYRPWTSFLSSNESLVSTLYNGPRHLFYVNQDNFSYTESLLRFVKDLGPTAHKVAYRKLQKCQNLVQNFQTQAMPAPIASNNVFSSPSASRIPIDNISCHPNARVDTAYRNDIFSTGTRETFPQNQSSVIPSYSYLPNRFGNPDVPVAWIPDSSNEYLTTSTVAGSGFPGNPIQSGDFASEMSQSSMLEFMLRNNNNNNNNNYNYNYNYSSIVTSPPPTPWHFEAMKASGSSQAAAADSMHTSFLPTFDEENQAAAVVAPELNHRLGLAQMGQCSYGSHPEQWGPQTVLDMSYLQGRLAETNSWGWNGISRPELPPSMVSETVFVGDCERDVGHSLRGEPSTRAFFDNHLDLALQL